MKAKYHNFKTNEIPCGIFLKTNEYYGRYRKYARNIFYRILQELNSKGKALTPRIRLLS